MARRLVNAILSIFRRRGWQRALLIAGCLAIVGWLYHWSPAGFRPRWLTPHAVDYYHEYADALLAGQLHLARSPDPRLMALPDPLDPHANAPFRLNDLSYHAGRYYLYHGIVPALVLLAPVKLLTGQHLALGAATSLFCTVGTVAGVLLLLAFRRRHAPAANATTLCAALIAMVGAAGIHVVLFGSTTNQLPIASAYCFTLLGLGALWRADNESPRPGLWLALASLSFGLAIGSRPNVVFAAALALPLFVVWQWRAQHLPNRSGLFRLACAGVPAALCVLGLLAINHARFGDPLEFGMRSMLGAWDQRQLAALDWSSLMENLRHYLIGPGEYQATFPFVTAPSWMAIGVLIHAPFVVLALGSLATVFQPRAAGGRKFAAIVGVMFGVNFLVLALLPSGDPLSAPTSANARYVLDFQGPWMLLAGLGALAVAHTASTSRRRWMLTALAVLLAFVSAIVALSLHLGRYPLESVRGIARTLSWPAWWMENWRGVGHGPLMLEARFPADRIGAREPLLSVGSAAQGDLVYVVYDSPGIVRFGILGVGLEGPLSEPVSIDPARFHRIELHLGPLNPPAAHPLLADYETEAIARLTRLALIRVDDRTVLETTARFSSRAGSSWTVGQTTFLLDRSADRFSGEIQSVGRLPLGYSPAATHAARFGPVRLRFRLPAQPTGRAEPLVTTGVPRAGDVLHITSAADGRVQFGFDHWGHRSVATPWLELDPSVEHELEFSSGALFPSEQHAALASRPIDERRALKERLRLVLDGRTILDVPQPAYESSPSDVAVGRNTIGASSCGYRFSGTVVSVERLGLPES